MVLMSVVAVLYWSVAVVGDVCGFLYFFSGSTILYTQTLFNSTITNHAVTCSID